MKRFSFVLSIFAVVLGVLGAISSLLYFLFQNDAAFMQRWLHTVALGWGRLCSGVCAFVPFSVAELCWTAAILGLLVFVGLLIRLLVQRKTGWKKALLVRLGCLACVGLFISSGYTALWGVGYRSPAFYSDPDKLVSEPVSLEDLTAVTAWFAAGANATSDLVKRDETGLFAEDVSAMFSRTDHLYDALSVEFPALSAPVRRAKPMLYSALMSRLGFTGFYFPFTGEANVNVHSPACLIPATIAHELAHQRGVVFEDEANFTAIAACLSQQDDVFRYSAYLMGYIHLSNALFSADRDAWQQISSSLNRQVLTDLEDNNAFWAKYESPVSDAAEGVYEGFLQSHGETRGMQSYGACVNLLVKYYRQQAI